MPTDMPDKQLDKRLIRASFDRAARHYDEVAVLQREVANNMLARLDAIRIEPATILDVGAGTGYCTAALRQRYPQADIILLDIAPAMLQCARQKRNLREKLFSRKQSYVCGDAETLPLADNSVDMLFSNLTLQWCDDLPATFTEFLRVLKPDGMLLFSSFGPDTLKELRESWQRADTSVHVHRFVDMHIVGDALLHSGFADPVMDVERYSLTYPDVYQLMRELKTLGAHNAANHRTHTLTGPNKLKAMTNAYERYRHDGVLPASYEVVFGHAWAPREARTAACGTVNVQLQPTRPPKAPQTK
jgi:malonyl-CoA O-methyltransferase